MDDSQPALEAETEAVREAYAALNRNDVDGFIAIFDPEIERIEPPGLPGSETYHGLDAFKALVSEKRATWAEGGCEPERFLTAGDKVLVSVHVRVRLKEQTDWLEGHVTDVYTFRNGKAIQFITFIDEREAFKFAGVEDSVAS